jgi:hypothetical protein
VTPRLARLIIDSQPEPVADPELEDELPAEIGRVCGGAQLASGRQIVSAERLVLA